MSALLNTYPYSIKPSRGECMNALSALGFKDTYETVIRYGVTDCVAAMTYVAHQRNGYAARNPGALVRWLLRHRHELTGWQWRRVAGFVRRFRSIPGWIRERLEKWLAMSRGQFVRGPNTIVEGWLLKEMEMRYGKAAVTRARKRFGDKFSLWRKALDLLRKRYYPTLRDVMTEAQALDEAERRAMKVRDETYAISRLPFEEQLRRAKEQMEADPLFQKVQAEREKRWAEATKDTEPGA